MEESCNIKYNLGNRSTNYKRLALDLRILYSQFGKPGIEDKIIKTLEYKYKSKEGLDRRLLLTDTENLDETSRAFIEDVNDIVCGLANTSLNNLSDKAIKFRNIVLSIFFDMNNVGEVTTQISESEKSMETDKEKEVRKLLKIEDTLTEIYGPINTGLIQEVTKDFSRELKLRLIYNNYLKTKYELNIDEVNSRIVKYKQEKFENILSYLKSQYLNDSILLSIESMYSNGILNASLYYYVIDTFKKHILLDDNRNLKFNRQLENKILLTNKVKQEELYKKLINIVLSNSKLNNWFNTKYNTNYINTEAKSQLFLGRIFSNYYLEIKDKLLKEIKKGLNSKDQILSLIHEIENPENDLLNYVNDYIILTLFDDLLSQKLGESIGIERGFLNNVEPLKLDSKKYKIKESHNHQKAGWETSNSESSELHTSTGIKDILNTINLYKYNENHELIPQTLDMSALMLAWQSLVSDILTNSLNFTVSNNKDVLERLKVLINTLDRNVLDNTINILEILFKPYSIANSRGRMIDFIDNENLLSELHKNILYSFYNEVLNKDNPSSNIAVELNKVNNNLEYGSIFLETVSDLCSILYRNVNNNYINCDLRSSTFEIKRKFNWDSDLFDLVERITLKSNVKQKNKLGEKRLLKYNYSSDLTQEGKFISKVELQGKSGKLYTLGFSYYLGATNMDGLFSTLNNLELENSVVTIDDKESPLLDVLASINIREFSSKVLNNNKLLDEYETVFKNLLEMFDYYLDTNFLSDKGLEILLRYKDKYLYDPKNKLYSKNYLNHLLKLSLRIADIDDQTRLSILQGMTMKEYLTSQSKYVSLFTNESKNTVSDIFDIQANKVYFKPVTSRDKALSDLAKSNVEISGRSTKSTSLNKSGDSVANYSISRLGSELNRRLHEQQEQEGPASSLLFVQNINSITVDPIIDAEISTLMGDVKSVRDMSSSELFLHAIFDKFYGSFLQTGKVCFLPTVYSDKTNFLNYLSNLSMFSEDVMNLMVDKEQEFINMYKNTFFSAHNQIQFNIIAKLEKLMLFLNTNEGSKLKKNSDIFDSNRVTNTRTFLRNRTQEELMTLVYNYNLYNEEKIELEMDKDYRSKKGFCYLNEIVEFYANLYNDPIKLRRYFRQQKAIFINDIKEYIGNFLLFNSTSELNSWIEGKLKDKDANYLVKILSSPKLLLVADRKNFAELWINKTTGELILDKNGELNPFLQKFFYIEGLFSNNLRLSLSGSEINHPDKAKDTLYEVAKETKSFEDFLNLGINISNLETANKLVEILANTDYVGDLEGAIDNLGKSVVEESDITNEFAELVNALLQIQEESIITIINVALGTQFKRNVIIPATLQHPLTGLINGVANVVNVAVVYDMKAPVNNLRESDTIDSQDGSAKMSPILVILENNSLGNQKVGTNRKPIWDDLTRDLTSFLAKFAAFGLTNAVMLQSLQSTSSEYNMFKKMHNIRWNNTIDLTKNINQFQQTRYDLEEVSRWFEEAILKGEKLFYKNLFGERVLITDFGKDESGYFTVETILGKAPNKVYHYFNDNSEHFTEYNEGLHTIDSLYELFVSLGGIYCVNSDGSISEFSNQVLTNFVINVGYKNTAKISSVKDIVLPLKDKFIGYVFNNSAVKNGAKNINSSNIWIDNNPLNTFKLNIRGLGIQLNADHDVVDLELTEFSLVVAACAAYGKDYKSINEIYYSLAESATQASEQELTNIKKFLNDYTTDPSKAKYRLYTIIGKLIVQSRTNNDMDLTERLKLEINKEFKISKDNSSDTLKVPFSDPSIYTQFITNITSVINSKSIKRKHPGSGYVMAPGYNIIQYFQWFDPKTKKYRKYLFEDVLKRARNDFKGKLRNELETWCAKNGVDPEKYGDSKRRISRFNLATLILESTDKVDPSILPYLNIKTLDVTEYNKLLVNIFLNSKLNLELTRDKSWFMPTDIVSIVKDDGTSISHDLSDMKDFYKFKNGLFDIEDDYQVSIKEGENKFTISLQEDKSQSFVVEKELDSDKWNIHFKTGGKDSDTQRRTPSEITEELKIRLFNATLQALPNGALLRLSPTTLEQLDTKIGGLTKGSIFGYLSIINNEERHSGVNIEVASEPHVVSYFDINGNIQTTEVSEYRKVSNIPSNHTYKLCVTKPNNLKPSLIRWQYIDPTDKTVKYMTIYDHPIIRNSWNLPKEQRPKQSEIQAVLDLLDKGKFELNKEIIDIIPGSLENTEAELVLGNMYKDIFQTGNNSLADIMDLGENFFKKQAEVPKIPAGFYNLAFIKNNGRHTLISFSNLIETLNIYEDPFDPSKEYVNEDSEIYSHKDGIKIGKYIPSSWKYEDGKVLDNGKEVDKSKYRLILDEQGNVEKILLRIDYVKRYKYVKSELVNGENQLINYTLYNIASISEIKKALNLKNKDLEVLNSDVHHQISSILNHIYSLDKYIDIQVNTSINLNKDLRRIISNNLVEFGNDTKYDKESNKRVLLTPEEILKLSKFLLHIINLRKALLEEDFINKYKDIKDGYYEYLQQYRKLYSSFLTSLHFISSRIPAQSLQSFMPMLCIGWTADTSNTAYVSYILTYLLGSDYDIDKAYIMGQSFSDDCLYIGWSSLFNYSSEQMLEASKTLPLPRRNKLVVAEGELYSIENELNNILDSSGSFRLRKIAELIYKIDNNQGKYNYKVDNNSELKKELILQIQRHENYKVNYKLRELAYKNVASANIRNVVHNIRNRDLAYSPITMKDLLKEASKSPKGTKTKLLNMINPLTKYIMLNLNLVGKNVIGIAANGEKDWFNLTYYYHKLLKSEDRKNKFFLKMNHSYSRLSGRAVNKLETIVVKHIPDLWNASPELHNKIKNEFYARYDGEIDTNDKYIDQLISLLLSAATDNAKELILAKINAGTDLAKYYLHMFMMGFNLKDVVSFMTSPVVELIDKYSKNDLYKNQINSVSKAIKILKGDIDISKLIVNPKDKISSEEKITLLEALVELVEAESEMAEGLLSEGIVLKNTDNSYSWIINLLGDVYNQVEAISLKDFFKKYITAKTDPDGKESPLFNYKFPTTNNMNTNYVFKYIDLIVKDISFLIEEYNKNNPGRKYTMIDFKLDLNEFLRITEQADETSILASVWLKLNQGIPQTDVELIKLIRKMKSSVSTRENKMGIKKPSDSYKDKYIKFSDDEKETSDTTNELLEGINTIMDNYFKTLVLPISSKNTSENKLLKVIKKIHDNNTELTYPEILYTLKDAIATGLYGNFDLYKFLSDEKVVVSLDSEMIYNTRIGDLVSYRELAATYYNLIKSSWNILDIVNEIPHYKVNIDLLNYSLQSRHLFANKSKIIDELISIGELSYNQLTDTNYKDIIKYADKILITSYFLSKKDPIDISRVNNAKVFDPNYTLTISDELYINSLNGIDSLKYFVENEFYEWLKNTYPENFLVKELVQSTNNGMSVLKTALNLFDVNLSLSNVQTYNRYLIGILELAEEPFDNKHSVADILMLYNLAVNGTKLGGKYLTGIFRDSINKGSVLYDYYQFMSKLDYTSDFKYIMPTKKDFLISIAPIVKSTYGLNYKTDPYVKVINPVHGYDVYRRYYNEKTSSWEYDSNKPESLIQLDLLGLTPEEKDERLYNYSRNSLVMFPELHRRLRENRAFIEDDNADVKDKVLLLALYIRLNRLLIYKVC